MTKKKKGKKIGIGFLIIAVFAVFVVIGWWNKEKNEDGEKYPKNAISVQTDEVKREKVMSTVKAKGIVEIKKLEYIYISNPAKVDKILVEVGDKVEEGQTLIKYDLKGIEDLNQKIKQAGLQLEIQELNLKNLMLPVSETEIEKARSVVEQSDQGIKDAISGLRQAEINYEQNERALEDGENQYKNNEELYKEGVISKVELERAYEQVKLAKERLEISSIQIQSAKRTIENAEKQKTLAEKSLKDLLERNESESYKNQIESQNKQIQLQQLQIEDLRKQRDELVADSKSPIKGTVLKISVEEGTSANPGTPIIEIGDLDQIYVKVDINEFDAGDIKERQEVKVTADAVEGKIFSGFVEKISPIASIKQGTTGTESFVQGEIAFNNEDEIILKPGYSVEIEIVTKLKEDATIVPILALIKDKDGTSLVYIVREDYSVEKRKVEVGVFEDLYVEVIGVREGEIVIINPGTQIEDGDYVRPIKKSN